MLPALLFGSCSSHSNSRKKIKSNRRNYAEPEGTQLQLRSIPTFNIDPIISKHSTASCCLRCNSNSTRGREAGNIKKMANKVSNFSDLIQRVTASCLLHPLGSGRHYADTLSAIHSPGVESDEEDDTYIKTHEDEELEEEEEEEDNDMAALEGRRSGRGPAWRDAAAAAAVDQEMGMLMGEVFEAVSNMKRAYVSLQEAHTPWDPDRMRMADVAVVGELRRLGVLRERFRRSCVGAGRGGSGRRVGVLTGTTSLREVVAPYEATVERLRREVKSREAEVEALREKLKTATSLNNNGGRKGKPSHQSKRRVSCSSQVIASPMPELFEATMSSVKEASKSLTSQLLSLMKAAHWDIAAAVRSIEAAAASTITTTTTPTAATMDSIVGPNHAKYALESYVNRKVFQGFDHETFYMDGSLSSLLNPDQFRHECFTQFRDMKAMDPMELLGILPTCQFGKFCSKKYLSIVHPKMEESFFGDLEQRRQVLDGNHPRSRFYGEFLGLAKAVWLLHLLAFALEPPPSHFEGSRGAEYHSQYMESVVRFPGGRVAPGQVVGFPVSPGFKLGDGSVVKARVYLVPKNGF